MIGVEHRHDHDDEDVDELWEDLRAHGLRRTGPRVALLDLLAQDGGHLTVADIHERLLTAGHVLDVTTVYRSVTTLVELGVLHATAHTDHPTSYGLATKAHHHAVCTRCGRVAEIPPPALTGLFETVGAATGFDMRHAGATVQAVCPECAASQH